MTINIHTEYTSPVDPIWNMIDNIAPGRIVFIKACRDELRRIERTSTVMPAHNRIFFWRKTDFTSLLGIHSVAKTKIQQFNDGIVVMLSEACGGHDFGDGRPEHGVEVMWRDIASWNKTNVYVFLSEDKNAKVPVVSIR